MVALLFGLASPALATTGNELYGYCNDNQGGAGFNLGLCNGYILGVVETTRGAERGRGGITFCPPSGVTIQQSWDIAKKFLTSRPELRHFSAPLIIAKALSEVWPCPK